MARNGHEADSEGGEEKVKSDFSLARSTTFVFDSSA